MSFDIYGNPLKKGHCEVHPYVAQEYPCDMCITDGDKIKKSHETSNKIQSLEERCRRLESTLKEAVEIIRVWNIPKLQSEFDIHLDKSREFENRIRKGQY